MYINKIHIQNYRNFSDFTMEFLRDIMESDFGIGGGSKGKISSQVEGLGLLHGIDKNEIYEFIRKMNPSEFSDDEFGYSKKAMGGSWSW